MRRRFFIVLIVGMTCTGWQDRLPGSPELTQAIQADVERALASSWRNAAPEWQARLAQDQTQKDCTLHRNKPPNMLAATIIEREAATILYPADGEFMGDWKRGEALAQSGAGARFTDLDPSRPNGGNCYACHQLDTKELSYGTLGPSLTGYGRIRKFSAADVKALYEKVYNAQSVMACSNMPRFGAARFLTIDQIRDIVAYVMAPDSPVNQP